MLRLLKRGSVSSSLEYPVGSQGRCEEFSLTSPRKPYNQRLANRLSLATDIDNLDTVKLGAASALC